MEYPDNLRYSREHEWVAAIDGRARVGITDFAQDALGDVVYVQLPVLGRTVSAGEACAEVESTKSVSEIYAPVGGTIVEVNQDLDDAPQRINDDPYGGGWIFALDVEDPSQLDALLVAEQYRRLVDET